MHIAGGNAECVPAHSAINFKEMQKMSKSKKGIMKNKVALAIALA